ncbi:MAG: hypothetical protein AAGJ93_03205 [Bacteroidota bacterium]
MQEPAPYEQAFMQSIESVTLVVREEFSKLQDADVEFAFQQLKTYYQKQAKGKEVEEPLSTSERRQVLMDEILNIIDQREELKADESVVNNPSIQPGGRPIRSLVSFYASCFNTLHKSVRFWRKELGKTGYLNYISQFL